MVSVLAPPPPPPLLLLLLSSSPPPHAATNSAMAATRQLNTANLRPRKVPPRRSGYNVRASYARRLMDRNRPGGTDAGPVVRRVYSCTVRRFRCLRAPAR